MSYSSHARLGFWDYIVEGVAKTTSAAVSAGAGIEQKKERAAKRGEQAARFELDAAQAQASATEQAAQITAEGTVDAAQIRIAAAKKAAAKQQQMLIVGGAVVALGIGLVLLLSGGKSGS